MGKIRKDSFIDWLRKIKLHVFYLLVIAIPLSKAAMEILFSVLFLLWVIEKIITKKSDIIAYFPKARLNWPIIAILVIGFVSIFYSVAPKTSLRGFFGKWFEFAMLYFLTLDAIDNREKLGIVLKLLVFSYSLVLFDGFWQFFFEKDIFHGYPLDGGRWIKGGFNSLNTFGAFIVFLGPIVITFLLTVARKKVAIYITTLYVFLSGFCLLFSYSLESWLALFFSIILASIYFKRNVLNKIVLFSIVAVVILMFIPVFRSRILTSIPAQICSNGGRVAIWEKAIQEIKNSPFLGKGINTTRTSIMRKYTSSKLLLQYGNGHSLYISMLLQVGIVGLLIYGWFLTVLLRTILSIKNEFIKYGFFISFFSVCIVGIFDAVMWVENVQGLFWIVTGLAVSCSKFEMGKEIR